MSGSDATTGERVLAWFESLSMPKFAAIAVSYSSIAYAIDHVTGDEIPLTILHLPVVALTCWVVSLRTAIYVSGITSILWLVDDLVCHWKDQPEHHEYCLAVAHGICFAVVAAVLARLRLALDRERRFGRTDFLTGVANSKAFFEAAAVELSESRRKQTPLTVAFLDCDNFKTVNDTLGHAVGDQLLASVARVMQQSLRTHDTVARMGGDEFAFLLPDTNRDDAQMVVTRVLEWLNREMHCNDWPVTFSLGVVTFAKAPESANVLLQKADEMMYSVKTGTKNGAMYRLVI